MQHCLDRYWPQQLTGLVVANWVGGGSLVTSVEPYRQRQFIEPYPRWIRHFFRQKQAAFCWDDGKMKHLACPGCSLDVHESWNIISNKHIVNLERQQFIFPIDSALSILIRYIFIYTDTHISYIIIIGFKFLYPTWRCFFWHVSCYHSLSQCLSHSYHNKRTGNRWNHIPEVYLFKGSVRMKLLSGKFHRLQDVFL